MVTEELLARVRDAGLCVVVRSPVAAPELARAVGRQLRVPVKQKGEATVAGGPADAAVELSIGSTAEAAVALLVCPSGVQLDAGRFQRDVLEPLRSAAAETGGTCTTEGGDAGLRTGVGGVLKQATFLPSGQVLSLYEQGAAEAAVMPSRAAPSPGSGRFLMVAGIVAVVVVAGVVAAVVLLSRPSSTSVDNTPTTAGPATPQRREDPTMSGRWKGTMFGRGSNYRFVLKVEESAGGRLAGTMRQIQVDQDSGEPTGDQGVETVRGSRTGRLVRLNGVAWDDQAPDGWYLDTIRLRLSPGFDSFQGTYTCAGCTLNTLLGKR